MDNAKVYKMAFSAIYPHYVRKAEKRGRTREEVDSIIFWLTGYDTGELEWHLDAGSDLETFFGCAPRMNPNAHMVTGTICGHRVEEIADPLMRNIRRLDKLVDELAKGRPIERILRG